MIPTGAGAHGTAREQSICGPHGHATRRRGFRPTRPDPCGNQILARPQPAPAGFVARERPQARVRPNIPLLRGDQAASWGRSVTVSPRWSRRRTWRRSSRSAASRSPRGRGGARPRPPASVPRQPGGRRGERPAPRDHAGRSGQPAVGDHAARGPSRAAPARLQRRARRAVRRRGRGPGRPRSASPAGAARPPAPPAAHRPRRPPPPWSSPWLSRRDRRASSAGPVLPAPCSPRQSAVACAVAASLWTCASSQRSASMAARQPSPAAVTAWR